MQQHLSAHYNFTAKSCTAQPSRHASSRREPSWSTSAGSAPSTQCFGPTSIISSSPAVPSSFSVCPSAVHNSLAPILTRKHPRAFTHVDVNCKMNNNISLRISEDHATFNVARYRANRSTGSAQVRRCLDHDGVLFTFCQVFSLLPIATVLYWAHCPHSSSETPSSFGKLIFSL